MEKIEYLYENDNTLKIIMNLKLGFSKTINFFVIGIIFIPIGLLITLPIVIAVLTFEIFSLVKSLSIKELVLGLISIIFSDYIGAMALYQWLKYNFGKEIILLNNNNQTLKHEQLIFHSKKEIIFKYANIMKVFVEVDSYKGSTDYYCSLRYNSKEFKIAQVGTLKEAQDLVKNIKEFMRNKHNYTKYNHKRK